jgi:hypothetical protein
MVATSINWPTSNSFPQSPQKGFTESIAISVLRSPMDMGPAKQRRRGKRPSMLGVNFILTSAQVSTLETFVKDTIKGIYRFNFTHPRTSSSVEVRIVPQGDGEFYKLTYLAPGFYQTDLTLEVLP